ncbi:MAG TPA: hypothetical protein PLM06_12895 [Anaerolineae bacterium]|nr:hypothetical protein [Anaerolineae bacterium]
MGSRGGGRPSRGDCEETALRQQVKPAGGVWNAQRKVEEVPYEQVVRLGLRGRLVTEEVI